MLSLCFLLVPPPLPLWASPGIRPLSWTEATASYLLSLLPPPFLPGYRLHWSLRWWDFKVNLVTLGQHMSSSPHLATCPTLWPPPFLSPSHHHLLSAYPWPHSQYVIWLIPFLEDPSQGSPPPWSFPWLDSPRPGWERHCSLPRLCVILVFGCCHMASWLSLSVSAHSLIRPPNSSYAQCPSETGTE